MDRSSKPVQAFVDKKRQEARERLEYLCEQLRAECISQGELIELQGLADYIEPGDVELLEPAGVPEFPDEDDRQERILAVLQSIATQAVALQSVLHTLDSDEDLATLRGIDHALDVLMEEPYE